MLGALSFGKDTVVDGAGSSTITGGAGPDVFECVRGVVGGRDLITDFGTGDKIDLDGYGGNEARNALKSQTVSHGSVTITLSGHTKITFAGMTSLKSSDFS